MKYNREIILWIYLLLINTISFALFKIDKKRARKREWRIHESTLLLVSFLGGAVGGILGMNAFRHKTKNPIFIIGLPLSLIFNIFIIKLILRIFILN